MGCCVIPMSGVFINGPLQRTHIFIQICLVFFTNSAWARSMGVIKTSVFYFISRLVFHLRCDWPHMHAPLWEFTVKWICRVYMQRITRQRGPYGAPLRPIARPTSHSRTYTIYVSSECRIDGLNQLYMAGTVCVCLHMWMIFDKLCRPGSWARNEKLMVKRARRVIYDFFLSESLMCQLICMCQPRSIVYGRALLVGFRFRVVWLLVYVRGKCLIFRCSIRQSR